MRTIEIELSDTEYDLLSEWAFHSARTLDKEVLARLFGARQISNELIERETNAAWDRAASRYALRAEPGEIRRGQKATAKD